MHKHHNKVLLKNKVRDKNDLFLWSYYCFKKPSNSDKYTVYVLLIVKVPKEVLTNCCFAYKEGT